MGKRYLIDSNILIYSLKGLFINNLKMQEIFNESFNISIISEIEFLGWKNFSTQGLKDPKDYLVFAYIYPLTPYIKEQAIVIKQNYNLKLGDAIIAATAICHDHVLVTRNIKDFANIEDLQLYNPF